MRISDWSSDVCSSDLPEGYLRVVVTRASASVPGCPNWDSKSSLNPVNATSSNYGCATNGNLAAMVADPNDLIKGTRDTGHDPLAATRAIQTYRTKPQTGAEGLSKVATSGGEIGRPSCRARFFPYVYISVFAVFFTKNFFILFFFFFF